MCQYPVVRSTTTKVEIIIFMLWWINFVFKMKSLRPPKMKIILSKKYLNKNKMLQIWAEQILVLIQFSSTSLGPNSKIYRRPFSKGCDVGCHTQNSFIIYRQCAHIGRELWSSGYGRSLMFKRSWVPGTEYWMDIFSHWFVVKNLMCVWEDKNKLKRRRGWPHF